MAFLPGLLSMSSLFWHTIHDMCMQIVPSFQRLMHAIILTILRQPHRCKIADEEASNVSFGFTWYLSRSLTGLQGVLQPNTQHHVISTKHRPFIQQSSNQKLIMIGIFAEVYLVDESIVRKAPRSASEEDLQPIIREATIYNMMNDHPRIAQCTSRGRTDFVDVKYYPHGDLCNFCQGKEIAADLKSKWFQQIIEAVAIIHSYGIIHSDLALRQFFIDDEMNIRLGDFNSSQYPGHPALGYEKATHCLPRDYELPNTVLSDIFALGSTLYELVTGNAPYSELYSNESQEINQSSDPDVIRARFQREHLANLQVEQRYKTHEFPDTSHLFCGHIISGFWNGTIPSAAEGLRLFNMRRN